MKLSPTFFRTELLAKAESAAADLIRRGALEPSARESYVRGYCKRSQHDVRPSIPRRASPPARHEPTPTQEQPLMTNVADIDIGTATGPELVSWYNAHAESTVKKFSSLKVARKRCADLARELKARVPEPSSKPVDPDRSAAVAASWQDNDVAAARRKRYPVRAKGTVFRSVREAFRELGLPDKQHQKFRKELATAGEAEFDGVKFTVVDTE